MKKGRVVACFSEPLPSSGSSADVVMRAEEIDVLKLSGNIYEASGLLEELSRVEIGGIRVSKKFKYHGYELWWFHYSSLFLYFCLPYTQYKDVLARLVEFEEVELHQPPYPALFRCFLEAHGTRVVMRSTRRPAVLPFGVLLQALITLVSIPFLAVRRVPTLVYTGDKFEKGKDYDSKMRFAYEELRQRGIPFVEFIRGIESWHAVVSHAWTRQRPVVYSDAVVFMARFFNMLTMGPWRARARVQESLVGVREPRARFICAMAMQYADASGEDVWAIRIMRVLLQIIGVRAAFIPVASERSLHTVTACKLNSIPTVGILHGVASRHYMVSDFLPNFDGEKVLSVDRYGVWSPWWKEHYASYSKAYRPGQLFVSGPMRPLVHVPPQRTVAAGRVRVLFIAEQRAEGKEVLPYLEALLDAEEVEVQVRFRSYRDDFEVWLTRHAPHVLARIKRAGELHDAIAESDVVVGSHSTAALEALLQRKPPIFFRTRKWGDYYDLAGHAGGAFFAETPDGLVRAVRGVRTLSPDLVVEMQERYFGNPHQNGSAWVVDQLEEYLAHKGGSAVSS